MKTIYLVRHGETDGNTGKIYQGVDTPLTKRGREQAELVAERCARLSVQAMVASTAMRAQQTAEIIRQKTGMSFKSSPLYTERRRPTSLMGRPTTETAARNVEDAWRRGTLGQGPRVEDGEHFDDLKERVSRALAHLEDHPADDILVITHGFFLRTLIARIILGKAFTGEEFKRVIVSFVSNNTGLTVLDFGENEDSGDVRWFVRTWNDHAHLG